MSSPSRWIAAVFTAALVATLTAVAPAQAHKRLYNATTTFNLNKVSGGDSASGQVSSKGFCVGGRTIVVFEDVSTSVSGDITEIGRTHTNATGAWSLAVQGGIKKDRTYFARISKRKVVDNGKHKHTCKGATSPTAVGA
jgi:hypothetical protein